MLCLLLSVYVECCIHAVFGLSVGSCTVALVGVTRTLSISAPTGQSSLVFAAVFVVVWCGAAVVTINAQLLGGHV